MQIYVCSLRRAKRTAAFVGQACAVRRMLTSLCGTCAGTHDLLTGARAAKDGCLSWL